MVKEGDDAKSEDSSATRKPKRRKTCGSESKILSKYWMPPRRKTFGSECKILYHVTEHGESIQAHGEMYRGGSGALGGGIYFASSAEEATRKAESKGWLVKAKVLTGKSKLVEVSFLKSITCFFNKWNYSSLQRHGFDSVEAQGFKSGPEYIVYNKDQVEILEVSKMSG